MRRSIASFRTQLICAAAALVLFILPLRSGALGEPHYVSSKPTHAAFPLVEQRAAVPLIVSNSDWPGVVRTVGDLSSDIEQVTGVQPIVLHDRSDLHASTAVIIGTIGESPLIDDLIRHHKLDVSEIAGKWEAAVTTIVDHPMPGVQRALVIAGSDKRGTIFAIYDLSEQIGVSPWSWWADVRIPRQDALFVDPGRHIQPVPAVKYRGIFLNDEAPALTGWVNEKFGGYNSKFYVHVFELLLRLKANYLWPAMWNSAFAADDPLNAKLADEYGIVMGTSHEEPMMRAEKEWPRADGPWNYAANQTSIDEFWRKGMERDKNYEQIVTLGMRGVNDTPMSTSANTELLEKIVANQRQILKETVNPDLEKVPQVWALYKEVQGYYDNGMRVPDDVTLLWSDDNWGNLRRLPTAEERKRTGGAGIYYHFDYVGDPRSYKWLNTTSITKVWEQMNLALHYGAGRIWVVNVGDLKPMEFPIEFFLTMARHPERLGKDDLRGYTEQWAAREFGPQYAVEAADLISLYTKYNGRRKPEQLDPETFSLTNYREADRVYDEWKTLTERAERLSARLPADRRDAFFELVLYPLKASAIVNELYITAGKNHLYAAQGRASANDLAAQTRALFAADAALSYEYNHKLLNGKWDHMMDQTHIGYTGWQEPPMNVMPAVSEVHPAEGARMGINVEGSASVASGWSGPLQMEAFDSFNCQTRFLDVFNRGDQPFDYTVSADQPWIKVDKEQGSVVKEERLLVSIDWDKLPEGTQNGVITISQKDGSSLKVKVQAIKPALHEDIEGFVEANHYVSIEAEHFMANTAANGVQWEKIPGFGETLSAMSIFPVTAPSVDLAQPAATLEYKMVLFEKGAFNVEATVAPSLNFVPGRGLRYAVSFDDQKPVVVDILQHNTNQDWAKAVSDGVRHVATTLKLNAPGEHTLKIRMVDPGVVLEKLVVSHGQIASSYLGPPESYHKN